LVLYITVHEGFSCQQGDDSVSNRRDYVDLEDDDELEDEVFRYRKPRELAAEHKIRKMRQEREGDRKKRQIRRRIEE
jgi:hypothetical protein